MIGGRNWWEYTPKRPKGSKPIPLTLSLPAEERLAAQWAGYTWEQYQGLAGTDEWVQEGGDSKAGVVASYRLHLTLEGLKWQSG